MMIVSYSALLLTLPLGVVVNGFTATTSVTPSSSRSFVILTATKKRQDAKSVDSSTAEKKNQGKSSESKIFNFLEEKMESSINELEALKKENRANTLFASFVTKPSASTTTTVEEDKKTKTIASTFGKPINEGTIELNQKMVHLLKSTIFDTIFGGTDIKRKYARFYALETIARVPYFSYISVLHLYETFGLWRQVSDMKLHFAESWNEAHHLFIMEELGGNDRWFDRFIAEHISFFYYWMVIGLYLYNPIWAYNFNEAIETEACETYTRFCTDYKDQLEVLPPPKAAIDYYCGTDMYLFDALSTRDQRRPIINNLYDVFMAIREDEYEHAQTMKKCQE